ncbi:tributyrin esterase [bacterium]|nr:tributyrin esterase [candidate division CSSED10-310 bacterium]
MARIQMNYYSDSLKSNTNVNIILPTPTSDEFVNHKDIGYFRDGVCYQVLYLLHGTYGDDTEWCRLTSIERYVQRYKLAVIMPSCANSYYYDMFAGPKYFTFLTEELPLYLSRLFPISGRREDTFIAGLSMGGYGAWYIAVSKPGQYAAAANLSGDLDLLNHLKMDSAQKGPWPFQAIFEDFDPKAFCDSENNLMVKLKKQVASDACLPRLFHTVGTEDPLHKKTAKYKQTMVDLGIDVCFEECSGIHDWAFWDTNIQRALEWFQLKGTTV